MFVPAASDFRARPYQVEAKRAVLGHAGSAGAMLVMATGTGKTATAHYIAEDWLSSGKRVVWLAHREELLLQPLRTLGKWWPQYRGGIVQRERNEVDADIVYASKDTLKSPKRMAALLERGHPDLLIVDECHHSPSPVYARVIAALRGPNTKMLGLTATPDREDTKKLTTHWEVVYSYSILDALDDGALLPPYAAVDKVPDLDLSQVGGRRDYIEAELGAELLKAHIVEHTVSRMAATHLARRLPFRDQQAFIAPKGHGCLVFTATVEQARLTAEALQQAGWEARYISGETPPRERSRLLGAFEAGAIEVLCNAVVLTEGTDLPRAGVVVLARPTKSWSLFVQMVGRALRPYEAQERALILDLVGATELHSIVAAPVLVDGTDCDASPDGAHRYLQIDETNEGRCQDCGKVIRCWQRKGGHKFKDGACVTCGARQCPESDDGHHHMVPWQNFKRRCPFCGLEVPDKHAGIAGKRSGKREPIAWKRLMDEYPLYASNLGRHHGCIFNLQVGENWLPMWVHKDKIYRLAPEPVPAMLSVALLEDVARRATKVAGLYGGGDSRQYRAGLIEALAVARRHRLWRT